MGIRFNCDNPKCNKLILAADEMAGKQDRCPGCGQLVTIPGAGGGGAESDKEDAAYFRSLQFLQEQTASQSKGQTKIARCQACCRLIPEGATVCPFCGRLGPLAPITPSAQASGTSAHAAGAGVFARSCMSALAHPQVEFRTIFFAAMSLMVWYLLHRLLFYFPQLQPSRGWQKLTFLAMTAPLALITVGYCLQVAMDHIRRAASETPDPEEPKITFLSVLYTGLMAVPLVVVYVLPVVTIPLLPVGLLALSMTRDARALNLRWSLRAAVACGEEFAFLWLLAIFSAGTLALLFLIVVLLASWIGAGVASVVRGTEGRILAEMVHLFGAGLAGVLACFLACGPIRCVGLVPRHRPVILAWMPRHPSKALTASAIVLGIGILALLVAAVI